MESVACKTKKRLHVENEVEPHMKVGGMNTEELLEKQRVECGIQSEEVMMG